MPPSRRLPPPWVPWSTVRPSLSRTALRDGAAVPAGASHRVVPAVGIDSGAAMNAFCALVIGAAIVVASIPVLVPVWALFLPIFREVALLAIVTISLVPVVG
jgi:hypothetical protein